MMALQIIPGTAKQFLSLVFSCSRSPRWTPFFALIVEIICVRKSRKTRYFPFPPVPSFRSLFFLFLPPERKYAPVITRHFAAILSARLLFSSSLIGIRYYHQATTRYKSRV